MATKIQEILMILYKIRHRSAHSILSKDSKLYKMKEELSNIWVWAKEHAVIKYVTICLTIAYALVTYKTQYMAWYDDNIMPILCHFISNNWIRLLTFILIVIVIYDIRRKYVVRYQYDKKVILTLFFVSYILVSCLLSDDYDYVNWILGISYVVVITLFCIAYIIAAIVNVCRSFCKLYNGKDANGDCTVGTILDDWPIEHSKDDIFDLEEEAIKLAEKMKVLDRKKTWSLAITAPWGTGKTSFLNLILEQISKKDFEVMHFIPRDSKSFKTIQEDFFTSIACVLSKYDSRCSKTLKDYMASLQLIDNRGVVEKFVNFYKIWNKDGLKDSIKQSFASLDKKVLVLIDDFDRLSKDEILEVLKLVDSNAAFTNLVFLTAYDKEQVNKSLGDSYKTKDACFVDKFFNLEFAIPPRPYSYISMYMEDKLCELLNASYDEKTVIQQTMKNSIPLFKEYIPTLRDAKRYINQFVLDFKQVRGDVVIGEFLLVQLIKYRYPELYKLLYKQEYLEKGNMFRGNTEYLYLKKELNANLSILPILNQLFPTDEGSIVQSYKHIYHVQSFDSYFVNQIYTSLRIKDMQALFSLKWSEVTSKIDEWTTNDDNSKDFIDYLSSFDMDTFENGDFYIRYTEMIAYLTCKLSGSRTYWLFMRTIRLQNIKEYDKKYNLNFTEYKNHLLDIIIHSDPQLKLITGIHYNYKTNVLNEDEVLIKDDDIWPLIKEAFIQAASGHSVNEGDLLNWLYHCVDNMEEPSRHLNLDSECLVAYRERVVKTPSYYIENFVRLGMFSSSPDFNTVACEPFWRQIFGTESQFEKFLKECRRTKIEKADLAWNFWRLYKANNYNPISYENQGPVKDKIDNNLVEEIEKLKKMKCIKKKVSRIPDNFLDEDKDKYKQVLLQCKKEMDNNTLYISLNGQIKKTIDEKLKKVE